MPTNSFYIIVSFTSPIKHTFWIKPTSCDKKKKKKKKKSHALTRSVSLVTQLRVTAFKGCCRQTPFHIKTKSYHTRYYIWESTCLSNDFISVLIWALHYIQSIKILVIVLVCIIGCVAIF